MKTSHPRLVRVFAALAFGFIATQGSALANSNVPTGWITASPGVVKVGALPTLKWEIQYPTEVTNHVTIIPPGSVQPTSDLRMDIRVLGAGVTSSRSDGSNMSFVHTECYFSYNNGSWARIFAGTNDNVNQSTIVRSQDVVAGSSLRFGGRFWNTNNQWSTFYTSNNGTQNVRVLKNGDSVPTTYNIANSPTLEQFIRPYLDAGGKVRIGPMDLIVMMELTHTDNQRNNQGYDLQDMVLLVTFKTK
ncbi:MAG: hypothetical protein MUF31_16425 [Akkermansiaceae bacterium]|jgi:hypothetical protein|nr:hypothetical protein [Akkermansiaceae bacterium]